VYLYEPNVFVAYSLSRWSLCIFTPGIWHVIGEFQSISLPVCYPVPFRITA